ncbi:FeS cluster assembly protein SufB [Rosistilla ulvae]|uniref:FeS cluster assembly protein SufB n=1 Tax=Rosistilla ulvae TaxID=1930277 RepID=A0A517M382_9BACT|nr:Fe-S cluster assembly protein SufD [Rosistilla ulvae]QDS89309.1 FeS cluster assembly protein SufB [Rosistilla ulvae]
MTQTATQTKFDTEGFEAFLATKSQPQWVVDARRKAWESYQQMEWPHRRHEEWIRSDLRLFNLDKFSVPTDTPAAAETHPLLNVGVDLAGHVDTLDCHTVSESLDPELAAKGVIFGSLDRLVNEHPEIIQPLLFSAVDPTYDRFAALHAAFWSGGSILYVPRGVVIDKPLHMSSFMNDGATDLSHTLVVLEEGAEATVLQESNSFDRKAGGFHCGAIELIQRPGSHLRFVTLQDWGYKTFHFAHQQAIVDRDATLQWTISAMGAGFAKVNQQVQLVGPGADSQVNGVMFTEGRQHLAYHTLQHHSAPNCHSDFLYKSAQQDNSQTVWKGMIKVDKIAQKTDGYQRNDNLLLSSSARADSIPGLEIEADDVRCTHGSTSSQVDAEQIFYARCRGFTQKEAVRMIVTGFFQQIFDRISIESVRDALGDAIAKQVRDYA